MKSTYILRVVLFCLLLWTGAESVNGQTLIGQTTWPATTAVPETVTLNNDVTMSGTVTVPEGVQLIIEGNNKTIKTYTTEKENKVSFDVKGTLIMKNVTLDGGCIGKVGNYSDHDHNSFGATTTKGGEKENKIAFTTTKKGNAIDVYTRGKIELNNVRAQNMFTDADKGCFLQVGKGESSKGAETVAQLNNVVVVNCLSNSDCGIINASGTNATSRIAMEGCTISYCMVMQKQTGEGYGGVLKGDGGTTCFLNMTGCTMSNCWGSGWGGAILWASGTPSAAGEESKATLVNCKFYYNYARYLGGAISNEAKMELTGCIIENNQAGFGGGGIAVLPFTLGSTGYEGLKEAVGLTLKENNKILGNKTLYVTNKGGRNVDSNAYATGKTTNGTTGLVEDEYGFNPWYTHRMKTLNTCYPSGGGGLWVLMNMDGWTCNLSIGASNEITGNSSAYNGGGVFLYKKAPSGSQDYTSGGNTSMTLAALIKQNTAGTSGGGVAVGADNTIKEYPSITVTDATIDGNEAKNGNGGGIYMPGGNFLIQGGTIKGNHAYASTSDNLCGNGGGISIANGSFKVENGKTFIVEGNSAQRYGGGLSVSNVTNDVTFTGGTFVGNSALAGGGVSWEGGTSGKTLTMNSDIEENTATNGGAIYLSNAKMVIAGGLIRNNHANRIEGQSAPKTASMLGVNNVHGIGGGIFMDNNTELTFSDASKLGIYDNSADNGADDIFANGNSTSVQLPNVKNMQLNGSNILSSELYWVEDYIEGDTSYPSINGGSSHDVYRYQEALRNSYPVYPLNDELIDINLTDYLCLSLGYDLVFIKLTKVGLKYGDDAIFTISYQDKNNPDNYIPYRKVIFTGVEDNSDITKSIALPSGNWQIYKSDWSVKYDTPIYLYNMETNSEEKQQNPSPPIVITKTLNKEIKITSPLKQTQTMIESESRKVNRLK